MFENLRLKIKDYHHKHEKRIEVAIFIGGFLFDAMMVKEPDEIIAIIQQALYLFIIAMILHHEFLYNLQKWQPQGLSAKIWKYREIIQPFLLGTLLNVYSIFYIKSASFFSSLIFLLVMIGMVLLNENPTVKKSRVSFKVGLFGICLFSFFSILYPIIIGSLGWVPFSLSVATTALFFYLQFHFLRRSVGDLKTALQSVLIPGISVLLAFTIFYILDWIPPVPLNVKEQGIYHLIKKEQGAYQLSTEREWWRIWDSGDENFKAQPGDNLYFYFQVYSPTHFSDKVVVHWLFKNAKGHWESMDKIQVGILGGRKEGFRGFTVKNKYQPGHWRVQVESLTGQEISRLYFQVIEEPANQLPREFRIVTR